MKIIKRDGRKVDFNSSKIENAILKAFKAVDGEISDYAKVKAEKIAEYIQQVNEEKELTIDDIQNLVEKGLMSTKRKDVAKAYISYRQERDRLRGNLIDKTIKEIVEGENEYWNTENSNKNAKIAST